MPVLPKRTKPTLSSDALYDRGLSAFHSALADLEAARDGFVKQASDAAEQSRKFSDLANAFDRQADDAEAIADRLRAIVTP